MTEEIAFEGIERLWDELLDRVENGEDFVILRGGKPVARLKPPSTDRESVTKVSGPSIDKS